MKEEVCPLCLGVDFARHLDDEHHYRNICQEVEVESNLQQNVYITQEANVDLASDDGAEDDPKAAQELRPIPVVVVLHLCINGVKPSDGLQAELIVIGGPVVDLSQDLLIDCFDLNVEIESDYEEVDGLPDHQTHGVADPEAPEQGVRHTKHQQLVRPDLKGECAQHQTERGHRQEVGRPLAHLEGQRTDA